MKTRSLMMKKCRNMKNEIKTRWGDSINFLYCSHIINKSRRSHGQCQIKVHFVKRRVKASFGKLGASRIQAVYHVLRWWKRWQVDLRQLGFGKLISWSKACDVGDFFHTVPVYISIPGDCGKLPISFRNFKKGPKRLRIGAWNKRTIGCGCDRTPSSYSYL